MTDPKHQAPKPDDSAERDVSDKRDRPASDKEAQERIDRERPHPAGPHATPEQTNPDATPGAGSLPDTKKGGDVDGGTG